MTKRQVLIAMIARMEQFDTDAERKCNDGTYKTMLDWHNDHQQAISEALNIATSNGYVNGAKWQLWDEVMKDRERKLNIHPN